MFQTLTLPPLILGEGGQGWVRARALTPFTAFAQFAATISFLPFHQPISTRINLLRELRGLSPQAEPRDEA